MSNNCPDFNIRTQFKFQVDDATVSCILNGLAKMNININGYQLTMSCKNCYVVRLVVGTSEEETEQDLHTIRKVLKKLDVKYKEKHVLQLLGLPSGIPGQFSTIFGALWCRLQVVANYIGEDNNLYLDVCHIGKALKVLCNEIPPQCPRDC